MIIGLTGRKQAGKDTVCERLEALAAPGLEPEVIRVSFADKLYASAAAALGVEVEDLRRWRNDPTFVLAIVEDRGHYTHVVKKITFRQYLQFYGTEAHRDVFGENFWTEYALGEFDYGEASADPDKLYVFTDVRFDNEAEILRRYGAPVLRVLGPPAVEGEVDGHASEQLPEADEVIDNSNRHDAFLRLDTQCQQILEGWPAREEPPPMAGFDPLSLEFVDVPPRPTTDAEYELLPILRLDGLGPADAARERALLDERDTLPAGPTRLYSPRMEAVMAVLKERERHDELKEAGRFPYTVADPVTNERRYLILAEELGEVAREVQGLLGVAPDSDGSGLRNELIQVAAIAIGWVEGLDNDERSGR